MSTKLQQGFQGEQVPPTRRSSLGLVADRSRVRLLERRQFAAQGTVASRGLSRLANTRRMLRVHCAALHEDGGMAVMPFPRDCPLAARLTSLELSSCKMYNLPTQACAWVPGLDMLTMAVCISTQTAGPTVLHWHRVAWQVLEATSCSSAAAL